MQTIYKIAGGSGGRCGCGHNQHIGKPYYLIETGTNLYTMCEWCGKQRGLDSWWGSKDCVSVEKMEAMWFKGESLKEVVCQHLPKYTRRLKNSSKREEMLESAVEV